MTTTRAIEVWSEREDRTFERAYYENVVQPEQERRMVEEFERNMANQD
jgi:hypothetical protein